MSVDYPEPGELVKTVRELVDSVNGGGGGSVDWSDVETPTISLNTTDNPGGDIGLNALTGNIALAAGDGSPNFAQLTCDGSIGVVELNGNAGVTLTSQDVIGLTAEAVSGEIVVQATGNNGTVNFSADGGTVQANITTDGVNIFSNTDVNPEYRIVPGDSFYFNNGTDDVENGPSIALRTDHLSIGGGVGATIGLEVSDTVILNNGGIQILEVAKGIQMASPDGTRYLITVANGGTISVTPV